MRAAGLLLLLLLGVSSQDDPDSADPGQTLTNTTTKTTTVTTTASTTKVSPEISSPTTTQTTVATTTKTEATQTPVGASTTVQTTTTNTTTATTSPAASPPPAATSPTTATVITATTLGVASSATTTLSHMSGQDSSSHSATTPKTTPAASSTASQQPSGATDSSGSSGTTAAAKHVVTNATSPPAAVGPSSPTAQPQGNQPLDHLPNTTASTTVERTQPSQSSKECDVSLPQCAIKQPPSSSPSVQTPTTSTSPGSTGTPVTTPTVSSSFTTTPTLQPGSKHKVPEAGTMAAPGADQSTHDDGSAAAKPTSASQSPASAQPPAPTSGDQTDQTEGCSSGHQHPNISYPNKLLCEDQVQHIRPTIQLKEPRTCAEWRAASDNNSFFETFCSTAQHVFDASRERCTVTLMACQPRSRHWAVWVVLHHPLDSEEVLKELKEKQDKLEELGIVNITSDKMVEDMTINDEFSTPLIITIITLAGSLLLVAAIYGCHQRFSQKKDQNIHPDVPGFDDGHVALIFNRLTEEMQTMENGYHDNPTLEVMETSSEMQEKKVNLNGELGDSWIVPLDTLMKEDLEEEEDTHL
ncbi:podocalyxin isoform X2 [Hirundo rustica]|uniref:podocalyxin isoform X2 n=1 Tax=Hirundo rustica TaxID=43150 RepID=UPI001A9438A2|nr:podocalyxin isoform X2 [Hirundo rustica]